MFHFKLMDDAELRLLEERYAEEIYAAVDRNRARLREWMPWVDDCLGADAVTTFIRSSLQRLAANDGFDAGIFVGGRFAGSIGFHHFGWVNRRTSLGYWLDQSVEGRGLMTVAVRAMTDHAIRTMKLNRVEIQAATGNAKSRAIPLRLGFRHEGTLREAGFLYDHYVDFEVYATVASEWVKR